MSEKSYLLAKEAMEEIPNYTRTKVNCLTLMEKQTTSKHESILRGAWERALLIKLSSPEERMWLTMSTYCAEKLPGDGEQVTQDNFVAILVDGLNSKDRAILRRRYQQVDRAVLRLQKMGPVAEEIFNNLATNWPGTLQSLLRVVEMTSAPSPVG